MLKYTVESLLLNPQADILRVTWTPEVALVMATREQTASIALKGRAQR